MHNFFKNLFFTTATVKSKKTGKTVHKRYLSGFLILLIAGIISFGTWNPTDYNFYKYATTLDYRDGFAWAQAFGVFLLWVLSFTALHNAVGKWGILAMITLSGFIIWGAVDRNWLDIRDLNTMGWVIDAFLTIFIWLGAMASRIWLRITGQMSIEPTYDYDGSDSSDDN